MEHSNSKSRRKKFYSKQSEEKSLRKVAELFYSFQTTPDEVEKYVELTEKTPGAKIMMQSCSNDDCACH